MKTSFLDTNIFIRYLTNDDPAKADRVASWMSPGLYDSHLINESTYAICLA